MRLRRIWFIYLQAPTKVLLDRIQKRAVKSEQLIELTYLENLNEAYAEFFHYYAKSPLLIVNSEDIDLANNEDDYQLLLKQIAFTGAGTHYLNPRPSLI